MFTAASKRSIAFTLNTQLQRCPQVSENDGQQDNEERQGQTYRSIRLWEDRSRVMLDFQGRGRCARRYRRQPQLSSMRYRCDIARA